ncbi:MAG: hypothetical protein JWQ89_1643 [Devosia sp.]|uniref:hypothetical protein n=1 Tax=Devosia sp. TaxID=1871048 RepID=UPI00262D6EFD|nr:hypothetical protein [Devosia sp.]MDB5539916.1 hypothetical protein [Devosia sp.]
MSRRPRSRRSLRKAESFPVGWAIAGGGALIAVLVGFGWLYMGAVQRNPERDANTMCPKVGPTEQVLVLVDVTDPVGPIAQSDILNQLNAMADALPKGGLFELRTLKTGDVRTETIFAACNPGDGSDLDHWTGNPEGARKRWDEKFDVPLKAAMGKALQAESADTSPIMAGIQQVAVDRLGSTQAKTISNRLVVISDLLENTPSFSMYKSGPDFESYLGSKAAGEYGTDLAGATVEVWLLRRDTEFPSSSVAEFWKRWVEKNRGTFERALQLQGMSP